MPIITAIQGKKLNSSISKQSKKNNKEKFEWGKFKKIFDLGSLVEWIKSCKELGILDIRKLVIISIILGGFYGYAYWKGKQSKPINYGFNYREKIDLKIPNNAVAFLKPSDSAVAYWLDDNNKKTIVKVSDSKYISKKMKPISFEFQPYFSYGCVSTEEGIKQDVGAGVSLIRYYKWHVGSWLSNNGVFAGLDYKLLKNFYLGGGYGVSWKSNNLVGLRARWDF